MRTDVTYSHSLLLIGKGFAQLGMCCWQTVMQNKALSLLVLSVMLNLALTAALAQERAENDSISQKNAELEIINDSLGGHDTNISFRYN